MKRGYTLCGVCAALLLFGGCGRQQNGASYIGVDQAKQLALDAFGMTAVEKESVTADLVSHNGQDCYQVDIAVAGQNYQCKIDAFTGVVVETNPSPAAAGGSLAGDVGANQAAQSVPSQAVPSDSSVHHPEGQAVPSDSSVHHPEGQAVPSDSSVHHPEGQTSPSDSSVHHPEGQAVPSDSSVHHPEEVHTGQASPQAYSGAAAGGNGGNSGAGSSTGSSAGNNAGSGAAGGMITAEDAKAAALTHAGLTADQVTFVESKLDYENGRQVYELEFYTADFREYDYEIDAYTGEVVGFDYDAEYYTSSQSADGGAITADQAKEQALAKVPGAAAGDIREFEVDYDNGRTEYEGKIIYNGIEYEFEIDGSSGQFLSWEEEPAGR